jgi:glycosyltransferase involved in cell wall biosynthesis
MITPKPIVSIFVHCFPPAKGGVEYLVGEIKKVLDQKFIVHVFTGQGLTLDSYKTFSNYINDHQKNIHRLNLHRQVQRFANKFLHRFVTKFGIFSPFFFGPILRYTKQDVDIIKNSDIVMGFGMPTKSIYDAYVFAKKYQKPLVVLPAYHNVSYYNHSPFFQQVFNYAKKIIFLTNLEKNELLKNYRVDQNKFEPLLFSPFNLSQIKIQQIKNQSRHYNFNNPVLGFVGQINPRKNLYVFKLLLDTGYQVLFAGAKTSASPEIEKYFELYIKSKKLKIIYDFPNSDKEKIYSQIDIFINPSIEESYGIVNIEAIFFCLPLLVHNNSAFSEILKNTNQLFFTGVDLLQRINDLSNLNNNLFHQTIKQQYLLLNNYNYNNFKKLLFEICSI